MSFDHNCDPDFYFRYASSFPGSSVLKYIYYHDGNSMKLLIIYCGKDFQRFLFFISRTTGTLMLVSWQEKKEYVCWGEYLFPITAIKKLP